MAKTSIAHVHQCTGIYKRSDGAIKPYQVMIILVRQKEHKFQYFALHTKYHKCYQCTQLVLVNYIQEGEMSTLETPAKEHKHSKPWL